MAILITSARWIIFRANSSQRVWTQRVVGLPMENAIDILKGIRRIFVGSQIIITLILPSNGWNYQRIFSKAMLFSPSFRFLLLLFFNEFSQQLNYCLFHTKMISLYPAAVNSTLRFDFEIRKLSYRFEKVSTCWHQFNVLFPSMASMEKIRKEK